MGQAIGLAEFKSIAKGIEALDDMTKKASIKIVENRIVCMGRYFCVIAGDVADVNAAIDGAKDISPEFLVGAKVIPSLADDVINKINAKIDRDNISAIGVVETRSTNAGLYCANYIKKSSEVEILRVSIMFGLAGKSVVIFTGDIASVRNGIEVAKGKVSDEKDIVAAVAIPSPSREFVENLFK